MVRPTASALVCVVAASLLQCAHGQAAAYAQCGGSGYTGLTTCVTGYACKVQNSFYSQCVPSNEAVTSVKPSATLVTSVKSSSSSKPASAGPVSTTTPSGTTGVKCTGTFSPISASSFVAALNPGWNLGNTLDAVPDETSWGNPAVVAQTFDDIKAQGFKSVRLPVTWAYHFDGAVNTGTSPDWTIQASWLQRVSDVLDMITARGLYVIVNVHHDSWIWADVTQANANYTMIEEKFYRIWSQAAQKLACKSSLVAFEPINEPPANTAADGARINTFNDLFLKAINAAGGFNPQRVVTLVGGGEDSVKTSQWFVRPNASYPNPWAIQYHYYSPYDFVFSAWGKTTWGSDVDKSTLDTDLSLIRSNFTDVPLVIGEWSIGPVQTEPAARWRYWDFFIRTAAKYKTGTIYWDNGNDNFNRAAHAWRDKTAVDILISAAKGIVNSLPGGTTDASAPEQSSSAYVWLRQGQAATAQSVPFLLNGNTFKSVSNGASALAQGADYTVSGSNITFSQAYLAPFASGATGIKANLTITFSAGAPLTLQVVHWAPPTLPVSTSKAVQGSDLVVPVTYNGVAKPATVRALRADGTYLVDDWTVYMPVLQQARTTFGSQWHWDWNQQSVTILSAAVDAVVSGGQSTVFTIEAWPRVAGNSVNYTLTV